MKKAFTLLEVVVSLGILALGILGIFSLIPTGVDQSQRGQEQARAAILAQSKLEEITAIAAKNWTEFNTTNHKKTDLNEPTFVGPYKPNERENWGWVEDGSGTWNKDLGFQWEWHFVQPPETASSLALITLTVSWPQKLTVEPEDDIIGSIEDPEYFKKRNIQFVRLISYVSKGL